jgi:hypothetical protein
LDKKGKDNKMVVLKKDNNARLNTTTTTGRRPISSTISDNDDTINSKDSKDSNLQVDDRYGYSTTTIDGELILLFRSVYRVERMYRMRAGKILSSIVLLLQSGSVHTDEDDDESIMHDDTIATMQLVAPHQEIFNIEDDLTYSTTTVRRSLLSTAHNEDDLISSTTSVRRPLSSTVPSLASSYSTTTIDGEWILLFRLAYRVDIIYQAKYTMIRHDGHDAIAITRLVIIHDDDDDDSIAIMQLAVIYARNCYSYRMKLTSTREDTSASTTVTKNPDSIQYDIIAIDASLRIQLAYRVDRMYRVDTILVASIGFQLRSDDDVHSKDDTIAVMQLVDRYQVTYEMIRPLHLIYQDNNDNDTIIVTQLSVLYHDDNDTIAITQLLNLYQDSLSTSATQNGEYNAEEYYFYADIMVKNDYYTDDNSNILYDDMKKNNNNYNDDGNDTSKDNNSDDDYWYNNYFIILYENDLPDAPPDIISVTKSVDNDYCNGTMRTNNGERTVSYSSQDHFIDDKVRINVNTSFNNNNDGDETTTLISLTQNGENKNIEGKYQLRALRSEGQYKDEVCNAEEGMFQEPIPSKWLNYNLVIISIYRLYLCFLLIVTMGLLVQSMGSVKIHKDRVNRASQTRARLGARLGSNCEPSNPAYRVTCLYVLPYLSFYVLSYLRKTPL